MPSCYYQHGMAGLLAQPTCICYCHLLPTVGLIVTRLPLVDHSWYLQLYAKPYGYISASLTFATSCQCPTFSPSAAAALCVPQVYLEDLAELPENPWALQGLSQVYEAMGPGAADKAADVSDSLACVTLAVCTLVCGGVAAVMPLCQPWRKQSDAGMARTRQCW